MSNELVRVDDGRRLDRARPTQPGVLTPEQVDTLKNTIAKGCTDVELELFLAVASRTGLDPFQRQIHCIKPPGKPAVIHIGIDGHRLVAERSGKWRGTLGPFWCGPDGTWRDVWLAREPPVAARVGVIKAGFSEPVWGIALLSVCKNPNAPVWQRDPCGMLAKCAEALAIRRSFPAETQGTQPSRELGTAWVDEDTGEMVEPEPEPGQPVAHWTLPPAPPAPPSRTIPHPQVERAPSPGPPQQRGQARTEAAMRQAESSGDFAGASIRAPAPAEPEPPDQPLQLVPDYPQGATCQDCDRKLTRGMWQDSHRSHGRPLCPTHQEERPTLAEEAAEPEPEREDPFRDQ